MPRRFTKLRIPRRKSRYTDIIEMEFMRRMLEKYPPSQREVQLYFHHRDGELYTVELPATKRNRMIVCWVSFHDSYIEVIHADTWPHFEYSDPTYEDQALARVAHFVQFLQERIAEMRESLEKEEAE